MPGLTWCLIKELKRCLQKSNQWVVATNMSEATLIKVV